MPNFIKIPNPLPIIILVGPIPNSCNFQITQCKQQTTKKIWLHVYKSTNTYQRA
jgi:hypothetical protein